MTVTWSPADEGGPPRDDSGRNDVVEATELRRRRIRAEYSEMPGLCLTAAQAARLWGLDQQECATLLNQLVEGRFLRRTRLSAFVRG